MHNLQHCLQVWPLRNLFQKAGHNLYTELGFCLTTSYSAFWVEVLLLPFSLLHGFPLIVLELSAGFASPSKSVLSCTHTCIIAWLAPFLAPQLLDSLFQVSPFIRWTSTMWWLMTAVLLRVWSLSWNQAVILIEILLSASSSILSKVNLWCQHRVSNRNVWKKEWSWTNESIFCCLYCSLASSHPPPFAQRGIVPRLWVTNCSLAQPLSPSPGTAESQVTGIRHQMPKTCWSFTSPRSAEGLFPVSAACWFFLCGPSGNAVFPPRVSQIRKHRLKAPNFK